ncbi:hypothetical protein BJV74DRAFT_815981 [Russula compacta]|nr:hypothetical protein BJV74DRAFT_815981 [Russula compacta]
MSTGLGRSPSYQMAVGHGVLGTTQRTFFARDTVSGKAGGLPHALVTCSSEIRIPYRGTDEIRE